MVLRSGMAAAVTAAPISHQTSAPMSLMSCVRESSPPLQDLDSSTEQEIDKNETSKKRRFHPFRGLRKMFRRKVRHSSVPGGGVVDDINIHGIEIPTPEPETPNMDSHRSRSTSELLAGDEPTRRKSGNGGLYSGHHGGLSVSHDSVFTGDPLSGSDLELDTAQSSSSLSIQQLVLPGVRAELLDAVRRRRGREDTSEDDEDLGLPRSPCNSPTTADILLEKSVKDHTTKSHSTCSDGSLLSMGSSEMDEDSFGLHSRHSSKVSLHEKKTSPTIGLDLDSELDLGDSGSLSAPLSHSAARHKMAVRPKRTHGAPRRRRVQQLTTGTTLPTTPEVNEETLRSVTPEVTKQGLTNLKLSSTGITTTGYTMISKETRLKSSSLPPGLALSTAIAHHHSQQQHLSRSRSNATAQEAAILPPSSFPRSASHDHELERRHDTFSTLGEEDEVEKIVEKKREESSFFGRLLSRRSGKKKKDKIENEITVKQNSSIFNVSNIKKRIDEKGRYTETTITSQQQAGYVKVHKTGPSARQRVEPIDIPASPELKHKKSPPLDIPKSPHFGNRIESRLPPTGFTKNICEVDSNTRKNKTENLTSNSPPKIAAKSPNVIQLGSLPKTEHISYRNTAQIKSSPERVIEIVQFRQKRMDAYTSSITETTSKITVNEETHSDNTIMSTHHHHHPRQRKVSEELSVTSVSPYSPQTDNILNISITPTKMEKQIIIPDHFLNEKTEHGFASLNHIYDTSPPDSRPISKSHSFKHAKTNTKRHSRESDDLIIQTTNTKVVIDQTEKFLQSEKDYYLKKRAEIKKSSSLDSVKSVTKPIETIKSLSIENVNQTRPITIGCFTAFEDKPITVSCNNNQEHLLTLAVTSPEATINPASSHETDNADNKTTKLKRGPSNKETSPNVPEFLKIQLNKVDVKPTTNVVLTANLPKVTPTKDASLKPRRNTIEIDNEIPSTDDNGSVKPKVTPTKEVNLKLRRNTIEISDNEIPPTDDISLKYRRNTTEINDQSNNEHRRNITEAKSEPSTPTETNASSDTTWRSTNGSLSKRQSGIVMPSVSTTPSSPIITKPIIVKKSSSLELIETKKETFKKHSSGEVTNSNDNTLERKNSETTVVLRKKTIPSKNEEPELMKVFARRSLKLNGDSETLGQQVLVMLDNIDHDLGNKSRDSDKENELDSPREERKKNGSISQTKEVVIKNKEILIDTDVSFKTCTVNNIRLGFGNKFTKSNVGSTDIIEQKPENNKWKKDIDIEMKNNSNDILKNNDDFIPMFKRIQQRKEEWEQRAQQAMKKTVP